jgi:hypothetical protein
MEVSKVDPAFKVINAIQDPVAAASYSKVSITNADLTKKPVSTIIEMSPDKFKGSGVIVSSETIPPEDVLRIWAFNKNTGRFELYYENPAPKSAAKAKAAASEDIAEEELAREGDMSILYPGKPAEAAPVPEIKPEAVMASIMPEAKLASAAAREDIQPYAMWNIEGTPSEVAQRIQDKINSDFKKKPIQLGNLREWQENLITAESMLSNRKEKISAEEYSKAQALIDSAQAQLDETIRPIKSKSIDDVQNMQNRVEPLLIKENALSLENFDKTQNAFNDLQRLRDQIVRDLPDTEIQSQLTVLNSLEVDLLGKLERLADFKEKKAYIDDAMSRINDVPLLRVIFNAVKNSWTAYSGPIDLNTALNFVYYTGKWHSGARTGTTRPSELLLSQIRESVPEFSKLSMDQLVSAFDSIYAMQSEFRSRMNKDSKKTLDSLTQDEFVHSLFDRFSSISKPESLPVINKNSAAKLLEAEAGGLYSTVSQTIYIGYGFKEVSGRPEQVVAHELSHWFWDVRLSDDQKQAWLDYIKSNHPGYLNKINKNPLYAGQSELRLADEALSYFVDMLSRPGSPGGMNQFDIWLEPKDIKQIKNLGIITEQQYNRILKEMPEQLNIFPKAGENTFLWRDGQVQTWKVVSFDGETQKAVIKRGDITETIGINDFSKQVNQATEVSPATRDLQFLKSVANIASPDIQDRIDAAITLGEFLDWQQSIDVLKDALNDPVPGVRVNVIKSLAKFGEFEAIKPMLKDSDQYVREAADKALINYAEPLVLQPEKAAAVPQNPVETPSGRFVSSEGRLRNAGMLAIALVMLVVIAFGVRAYVSGRRKGNDGMSPGEIAKHLERALEKSRRMRERHGFGR